MPGKVTMSRNLSGTYEVTYPKDTGRSSHVDSSVRVVSLAELRAVVDEVASDEEGKRMLGEEMMALVSPRVFWAFRLHFPGRGVHDVLRSGDASTREGLDWGWLGRRERVKSEKSREEVRKNRMGGGMGLGK